MIVLHGSFLNSTLLLWGESPREATPAAPENAPLTILIEFLSGVLDHLVHSVGPKVSTVPLADREARERAAALASLHDQWLHALRSPDETLEGEAAVLAEPADGGAFRGRVGRYGRVNRVPVSAELDGRV